jgi:hypothetical protein
MAKEINYSLTLEGMTERHNKFENNKKKRLLETTAKNPELIYGIELLYQILEKENIKMLTKLQREFQTYIQPNADLVKLLKPPYLVPEIVNNGVERALNDF